MSDDLPSACARQSPRPWNRERDRRDGIATVLAQLVGAGVQIDAPGLRARLEEAVRPLVPVKAINVRDAAAIAAYPIAGADSLCLPIPGTIGSRQMLLQAIFDQPCALDDWDLQLLEACALVASLALEIERTRSLAAPATVTVLRPRRDGTAPLIGTSARMSTLRQRIERVAHTDFTILIEGESGSGKELVARQIHHLSRRRKGPFVAVNCAALVESLLEAELFGIEDRTATGVRGRRGKFESADTGTLFLDEVSDLSPAAQAKLLRAIQDLSVERVGGTGAYRVDTRIVVATNRGLTELVDRGTFRSDLYYRLNGVEIHVPPLRERREDILELANYFLDRYRSVRCLRLSSSASDALVNYDWPGNVRELERVIERALALAESDEISLDDLPASVRSDFADVLLPSLSAGDTMRAWGSRYARLVLQRCEHNKRRACKVLDISYHTLQAYLGYRISGDVTAPGDPTPWDPATPTRRSGRVSE